MSDRADGAGRSGTDNGINGGGDPSAPDEIPRYEDRLIADYGRLRAAFKRREQRFAGYRQSLNQARMPIPYDVYLARTVRTTGQAAIIGGLLGLVIGAVGLYTARWGTVILISLGIGGAVLSGSTVGGVLYLRPLLRARRRRAQIEYLMPYGVAYLYALSQGGVGIIEAIRALADSPAEYGALAREFDTAVQDVEYLGADPIGALETLKQQTPSSALAAFLDGLVGTIQSGGDVTRYLSGQSDEFYKQIEREQDAFLDEIALYAELYVGLLVVGPIFGVIVLLVIAVLSGPQAAVPLAALIYLGVPVLASGFLWLTMQLTDQQTTQLVTHRQGPKPLPEALEEDPRATQYLQDRRPSVRDRIKTQPVAWLQNRPLRSLLLTVPIAGLIAGGAILGGIATPGAMTSRPVETTTALVVLPTLTVVVPLMLLYERNARRERAIGRQLPELLDQLAGANRQGLTLSEGLELAAKRSGGVLGDQLRRTANDVQWGAGIAEAFDRLRTRLHVATVDRTVALLTDASRYSSNLYRVIEITARDTRRDQDLIASRRSETRTYVIIVVISFGLYLFMLVVLDSFFLTELASLPAVETAGTPIGQAFGTELDQSFYRMLLFHSALIQGFAAGAIAGELGEGSWRRGIKYSVLLVSITTAVFGVFVGGV